MSRQYLIYIYIYGTYSASFAGLVQGKKRAPSFCVKWSRFANAMRDIYLSVEDDEIFTFLQYARKRSFAFIKSFFSTLSRFPFQDTFFK